MKRVAISWIAITYYREEDDALAERFAARYIAVVERCREFPHAGTRIATLAA